MRRRRTTTTRTRTTERRTKRTTATAAAAKRKACGREGGGGRGDLVRGHVVLYQVEVQDRRRQALRHESQLYGRYLL